MLGQSCGLCGQGTVPMDGQCNWEAPEGGVWVGAPWKQGQGSSDIDQGTQGRLPGGEAAV